MNRAARVAWAPTLACLVSAALFGASTPASKRLLGSADPVLLAGALYAGAALAVAPWAWRGMHGLRDVDRANVRRLAGTVVAGGVIAPLLLLFGLARAPAGSVALWLTLESVATALLARAFFKEHLHAATWMAVFVIVAASALLSPGTPRASFGALLVVLACVAWGIDNNLSSLIDRFTPAQIVFAKGVVAGAFNSALGLALGARLVPADAARGLFVGALGYGASLLLYIGSAQQLGAVRSQLIFATGPLFGLVLAWAWLGESLTPWHALAACAMAAAIWLWHRERHEHRHLHAALTHTHWHRHDDGHHAHPHARAGATAGWHSHEHCHEPVEHAHPHRPDLHHRHGH